MKTFAVWMLTLILIAAVVAMPVPNRRGSTNLAEMPAYITATAKVVASIYSEMKILEYSIDKRRPPSRVDNVMSYSLTVTTAKCGVEETVKDILSAKCFAEVNKRINRWCRIDITEKQKDGKCVMTITRENK